MPKKGSWPYQPVWISCKIDYNNVIHHDRRSLWFTHTHTHTHTRARTHAHTCSWKSICWKQFQRFIFGCIHPVEMSVNTNCLQVWPPLCLETMRQKRITGTCLWTIAPLPQCKLMFAQDICNTGNWKNFWKEHNGCRYLSV